MVVVEGDGEVAKLRGSVTNQERTRVGYIVVIVRRARRRESSFSQKSTMKAKKKKKRKLGTEPRSHAWTADA